MKKERKVSPSLDKIYLQRKIKEYLTIVTGKSNDIEMVRIKSQKPLGSSGQQLQT